MWDINEGCVCGGIGDILGEMVEGEHLI